MRKQILLPKSVLRELRADFKVSGVILYRALKYERNSKRDRMLRAAALERGGLIYTGERAPRGYCPNVDTHFDHARGIMYQSFSDRVALEVSLKGNAATIIIDHQPVATFNGMTVAAWGDVLYSLRKIYNQLNA